MNTHANRLVEWIRETARPARGLLLPISGGSDSALAFWAFNQVYPEKTVGVFAGTNLRCRSWFEKTGTIRQIPMPTSGIKEARLWLAFLEIGVKEDRWLVGSRNLTEELLGTFSLASRLATYLPLVNMWKSEVMALCDAVGIPPEVTQSSREADPACGRPAEMAEIPLELIDLFLQVKVGQRNTDDLSALTEQQVSYLDRVYALNSFRKTLPVRGPVLAADASPGLSGLLIS